MSQSSTINTADAIEVLSALIRLPSFSKEENATAACLSDYLVQQGIEVQRFGNNIIAKNKFYTEGKPTILLNSHHDTVKPNAGYTLDPFNPIIREGKLYGLGSNDAGGSLVALLFAFLHFYSEEDVAWNLIFAATAEEEISGTGGIEAVLPHLPVIDCALVGEPTQMQMAVAERGLVVLDCAATGRAGHAAREEGESALYKAIVDIEWIRNYRFRNVSGLLGEVKLSVTSITTPNKAHNVVPDACSFIIDARVNERYTLEEVVQTIRQNVQSSVVPRSIRLRSSMIALQHPLVQSGLALGKTCYGSPTTSDKALMPFPALKMGPGHSARSHTADEFIYVEEVESGISDYIELLTPLLKSSF